MDRILVLEKDLEIIWEKMKIFYVFDKLLCFTQFSRMDMFFMNIGT